MMFPGFRLGSRLSVTRIGVGASLVLLSAAAALAAPCGDDVGGRRVACRCGDEVVSDTVLWATDPVVSMPCPRDGLRILAPEGSDGIRLDLDGHAVVGTGHGVGIRVVRGGRLGSTIVGGEGTRGQVLRFGVGIQASGRLALRELQGVDTSANQGDGVAVTSSGASVSDVAATGNGGDGMRLSGHGLEATGVEASGNVKDGLRVRGTGAGIAADTRANGRHGAVIGGRGNDVSSLRSTGNGGVGLYITGDGNTVGTADLGENAAGDVAGREGALR